MENILKKLHDYISERYAAWITKYKQKRVQMGCFY